MLTFNSKSDKKSLTIRVQSEIGIVFTRNNKKWNLVIHNIQKVPKKVKIARKQVNIDWDSKQKILNIPLNWNTKSDLEVNIKY